MSRRCFTHATSTLFNAGTSKSQMSACFLITLKSDNIDGVYDAPKSCVLISRLAGGIGAAAPNFNETARYVDQRGDKRKGSGAICLEQWYVDIFDLLELRKNNGREEQRTRNLFYELWIPDLFEFQSCFEERGFMVLQN